MNARAALTELSQKNISARLDGSDLKLSGPNGSITPDLIAELRPQKPALIAELKRRQRRDELLMLLADNPGVKYVYVVDASLNPVIVAIGIRDLATFEMSIPASQYDPWKLATLIDGERGKAQ